MHTTLPDAPIPTLLQRSVISVIAGIVTALVVSLVVGVMQGIDLIGTSGAKHGALLWESTSTFLLSLVVTLPFGFILVPAVSLLLRRTNSVLQLLGYLLIPAAVAQWVLPYSPRGDGIPFFAFAAFGGLVCLMVERGLLCSSWLLRCLTPGVDATR